MTDKMFPDLKKWAKQVTLMRNKTAGKMAESNFITQQTIAGNKVERKGHAHGSDFKVTRYNFNPANPLISKKGSHYVAEIKSSASAKLSSLQEKTKKKLKGKYKVIRPSW